MKKKSGRIWVVGVSAPAVVTGILRKRRREYPAGLQGAWRIQENCALCRGFFNIRTPWELLTALLLALPSFLPAQEAVPPALENTGKPIAVPFHCTEGDVEWAGLACTERDPCPAYLELSAVEGSGDRIVAAGNIHSEAVTLFSLLLESHDSGRTWREPFDRIRGAGLDRAQIGDGGPAWVGGAELFPITLNPFILITEDGKAWRRAAILDEPLPGAIQQFHFDNSKDGSLVLDRGPGNENARYERYDSHDGGASWILQEGTAKPPALAAPAQPSVWRLLDDAASHSFRIEHMEGGRWSTVAAFAVAAGMCKPEFPAPQP